METVSIVRIVAGVLLAVVFMGSVASADNFNLNDWLFNVNGTVYNPTALPANFNASGLSSGVYLYELQTGSNSTIKKMTLMK